MNDGGVGAEGVGHGADVVAKVVPVDVIDNQSALNAFKRPDISQSVLLSAVNVWGNNLKRD